MQTRRLYLSMYYLYLYIFIFSSTNYFLVHSYAPKARMLHVDVAHRLNDISLQRTVRYTCCAAVSRKAYTPLRTANILSNLASSRTSFDCFFFVFVTFSSSFIVRISICLQSCEKKWRATIIFFDCWFTVFVIVSRFISIVPSTIYTLNAHNWIFSIRIHIFDLRAFLLHSCRCLFHSFMVNFRWCIYVCAFGVNVKCVTKCFCFTVNSFFLSFQIFSLLTESTWNASSLSNKKKKTNLRSISHIVAVSMADSRFNFEMLLSV